MPSRYVPTQPTSSAPAEKSESAVSKGFRLYNTPIIDMFTGGHDAMTKLAQPGLNDSKLKAQLKGFVSGATEAVTPALVAQAASLGSGTPAVIANSLITAQGARDVLDSDKSAFDRGMGGLAAIGGGAGALSGVRTLRAASSVPDKVDDIVKSVTHGVADATKSGHVSDVGTGGLRVGPETPRVVKRGGVINRVGEPEVPKVTEVKSGIRAATVPKEAALNDVEKGIDRASTVAKAERGVNETARKAENKLLRTEQTADLQDVKAQQQAGASVESTLPRLIKQATAKTVAPEVKDLDAAIKAEKSVAAKARAASGRVESQGVRAEQSADLQNGARETRDAANAKNLAAIEQAKIGLEPTLPRISESVSAKTGEGQRSSMSRSFVEPKPPETGKPVTGESMTNDIAVKAKDIARQTIYRNKDTARDAAIATGAKDYIKISRGNYRLVFDDVKPVVNEPVAPGPAAQKFNQKVKDTLQKTTGMLPDEEPVLPTAPPAEKAVANEMAPSLERDVIAGKRYTNKSEASAIAKATGGTIHQDGPRRYSVRFTPEEVPVAEPITPTPTIELPKPKDMPRANVAPTEPSLPPLETGDLTPDEFRRYMDIRPSRGISRTPAEVAEYKALQQRINARPPAVEVSDYTGGQPQHTIEAPVPGTPEQAMEDMAAVANKPGPPVAKVNFPTSKLPGKSQIPDEVQSSLLDAAVPEVPQGGAIPARMFKSKAAATAENYGAVKAAKAAGETVPEEGRAIAGKTAAAERKAAALDATSDDLTKMTPEDQSKALSDLVKKFKSSKGEINMVALSRLGLGAAGAAAGAAATPDDPLTGALLGGAAGAFAPSVVRALIGHASSGNVPESSIKDIAAKAEDTVKTFFRMMPDYQRFSLLSSPVNLAMNMWVGPWGSAIMAGLEHAIQLDPKGMDALKLLLNPKNFPKEFWNVRKEAGSLIHNAEERTEGVMGLAGPKWFRDATSFPGVGMTAGDVAARNLLMKAGFSADEARTITLTSEPYSAFGRMVSSAKKGAQTEGGKKSWFVNMALPFYRTNVNQIEQSLDRTPFIGILWNKYAKDIPEDTGIQIAKQLMGGGVTAASYLLGTVVPPDDNRYVVKFINNFGGQYGKLASVAFVMGQAKAQGKEPIGALQQSVTQDMPLPSMDIINNVLADIRALKSGQTDKLKMPFKVLPGMFDPKVPGSVPQLIGGGLAIAGLTGATPTDTARPTQSPSQPSVTRSRYIPTSPKR